MNRRRAAEAGLIFNVIIWGATFVLVKTALLDVSPILFIALRFTLATAVLLAVFRGAALPWRSWKTAGAGALAGAFLFSGYAFQTMGLRLTTAPRSAISRPANSTGRSRPSIARGSWRTGSSAPTASRCSRTSA